MSSDSSSVDPQAIEQTKRQIRGLVDEIAALAKQDLRPEVFYTAFLQRVVEALAAVGGAVWLIAEGKQFQLAYQINLRRSMLDEPGEHQARHARLLGQVVQSDEGLLVPPHSGSGDESEGANPTELLLVLAPLRSDRRVEGVVEIFQRPTANPATRRGYLRFLVQMCDLAGEWLKSFRLQQFTDRESLWSQVDQLAQTVHDSLDLRQTAYSLANEAQRLLGCDRVSVAVKKGQRCKIYAVSGQDLFDERSNVVTLLGALATKVVASGEALWYSGSTDDLAPQIEDAIHEYVDHSHAKTVAVIPLRRPMSEAEAAELRNNGEMVEEETTVGALIVEQIEDVRPRETLDARLDLVCAHGSRALANAVEHRSVFLLPVWETLGKSRWLIRARTLPKTLAVLGGVLAALLALIIVPADFDLKGRGELQPVKRRDVFADQEGRVREVKKRHGDPVAAGDELVILENTDLDVKLQGVLGELRQTEQARNAAERSRRDLAVSDQERQRASGEAQRLEAREDDLQTELQLLRQQSGRLTVRSPIDGEVTTWDVENLLRERPVNRGEVLMSVADPKGEWELQVFMPENRMGHIMAARQELEPGERLSVEYIVATDPNRKLKGVVREIHRAAEMHEEHGHAVKILVEIDKEQVQDRRPGLTVTAKVHCGRRSIGYVWLHDLFEWFQSRVLFHL
jgi:multidrug efflux pump subunit AcrA (membrane-fusion protein)